jgi:hypothetical protein
MLNFTYLGIEWILAKLVTWNILHILCFAKYLHAGRALSNF